MIYIPRYLLDFRFSDSPTPEEVLPTGRGKRRAAAAALHDMTNYTDRRLRKGRRSNAANMPAPPSPARPEYGVGRRKRGVTVDPDPSYTDTSSPRAAKRSRSNSGNAEETGLPEPEVTSGGVIECPEPSCNKKYKHINGLRYHQTHAHHQGEGKTGGSRPQTPTAEVKVTPRGRKKKKGRDVKSAPNSPVDRIITRASTPNSLIAEVPEIPPSPTEESTPSRVSYHVSGPTAGKAEPNGKFHLRPIINPLETTSIQLCVHVLPTDYRIYNKETFLQYFLENIEEMFRLYDMQMSVTGSSLQSFEPHVYSTVEIFLQDFLEILKQS